MERALQVEWRAIGWSDGESCTIEVELCMRVVAARGSILESWMRLLHGVVV